MSARSQGIELITRGKQRPRWSVDQKREIATPSVMNRFGQGHTAVLLVPVQRMISAVPATHASERRSDLPRSLPVARGHRRFPRR